MGTMTEPMQMCLRHGNLKIKRLENASQVIAIKMKTDFEKCVFDKTEDRVKVLSVRRANALY